MKMFFIFLLPEIISTDGVDGYFLEIKIQINVLKVIPEDSFINKGEEKGNLCGNDER